MTIVPNEIDAVPSDDTPGTVVLRLDGVDWVGVNTDQARELAAELIRSARERDIWDVHRTAGAEGLSREYTDTLAGDLGITVQR